MIVIVNHVTNKAVNVQDVMMECICQILHVFQNVLLIPLLIKIQIHALLVWNHVNLVLEHKLHNVLLVRMDSISLLINVYHHVLNLPMLILQMFVLNVKILVLNVPLKILVMFAKQDLLNKDKHVKKIVVLDIIM